MASNVCVCVCSCVCVCVCSRTCLLECKCIPQSARPCHSSARPCHPPRIHQAVAARPCHPPRIHQAVAHHMYCAFFCHCTRRSQNSIKACDIRESIQWVRFAFLCADISFASSLPLAVFESDASKPDSNPQFVFMLHETTARTILTLDPYP